ncbi:hypothetical protein HGRIS_014491 [Hohenbuehelia grisea]|uniref:lytic cellulose monooxygenase (C4-dehydrogenating) n=1 Tax=Hohenbuehelia grisea TaxID=104357 RepID=A0ABR3JUL0_9AGAR
MLYLSLLPLALSLPAFVSAHGFVRSVTIGNKLFEGNVPNAQTKPSAVRQINDVSPVKGAANRAMNCGPSAKPGSLSLKVSPGDNIAFDWAGGDQGNWPHNTGPMLTYMASCGDVTCDKFDAINAKWFKVQQVGRKDNGKWAQEDLMSGQKAELTLPANIAPGNYLIRHEIIGLHLAETVGGAEFYPSCSQLIVGGSGTGVPKPSELVSFPGAYTDNDAGIFLKNAFNPSVEYIFPGPPIASFIEGSSPQRASAAAAPSVTVAATANSAGPLSPATVTVTVTAPAAPSGSPANAPALPTRAPAAAPAAVASGSRNVAAADASPSVSAQAKKPCHEHEKRAASVRPRRLSRVMRQLADDILF